MKTNQLSDHAIGTNGIQRDGLVPLPIRARRQDIYHLPSAICKWLDEAAKHTERARQPPVNMDRNNNAIEYLLFYDEVRCIVNLAIGQVIGSKRTITSNR